MHFLRAKISLVSRETKRLNELSLFVVDLRGIDLGSQLASSLRPGHRLAMRPAGRIWLRRSIPRQTCLNGMSDNQHKQPDDWLLMLVDLRGIEPLTFAMRMRRSTK